MSQNPIDKRTLEIENDQPELGPRTNIFKDLGLKIPTFLSNFCEMTAAASILRKKCLILHSVFLCSGLAFDTSMTTKMVRVWFYILYLCLGYRIIEDIVRYNHLKKANERSQGIACFFQMTHKITLMFSLLIFNLKYRGIIAEGFILLTPILFLLETALYWTNCSTSQPQNIVTRLCCIFQSVLIAAKMNDMMDLEWKTTLVFVWIYLGINAISAILAGGLLVSMSFRPTINLSRENLVLFKTQVIGYIWHVSFNVFNVFGLIFLIGHVGETGDLIQAGLYFAQKLSLFLGVYTVVFFPLLKTQTFDLFKDLLKILQTRVPPGLGQKKYTLVKTQNLDKKESFLMISSTYFSILKKAEMKERTQKNNIVFSGKVTDEGEHLCYICENNEPNAIISGCGHGGVCCGCVVKSIECKNECMECRRPVKAIYKIESESKNGAETIVQASEFVQAIEVEFE